MAKIIYVEIPIQSKFEQERVEICETYHEDVQDVKRGRSLVQADDVEACRPADKHKIAVSASERRTLEKFYLPDGDALHQAGNDG